MSRTKPAALPEPKLRKKIMAACLEREITIEDGFNYCATLSPDGTQLLIGQHGSIAVVDVSEGTTTTVEVKAAKGDAVSELQFLPDGDAVVATLWVGSVAVLSWPKLKVTATHDVCNTRLHGLAVMPDGASAWVGGHDAMRTRVDLKTGKKLAAKGGETFWLSSAAISGDGSVLVTADAASKLRLCDPKTGAVKKTLDHYGTAYNLVVRDNELLAPGLTTTIVDMKSGKVRASFPAEHKLGAKTAVFLADDLVMTGGGHDPLLSIWDVDSGKPLLTLKPTLKGAYEQLVMLPSGEQLLAVPAYSENPILVFKTAALIEAARQRA